MIVFFFLTAILLVAIDKLDLQHMIPMVVGYAIAKHFYFVCHKCNHPFNLSKNKLWVNPFYTPRYCRKCGQDLLECDIESDEVNKDKEP
jgi:rRNA maturation endonuclease Nob1